MHRMVRFILLSILITMTACGPNGKRDLQKSMDASNILKGEFKGYATCVYKIDFVEGSYERLDGELLEYKVYKDGDEYTIEYDGETYPLYEADNPIDLFGSGLTILRWKFDYNHYIEEIPTSY